MRREQTFHSRCFSRSHQNHKSSCDMHRHMLRFKTRRQFRAAYAQFARQTISQGDSIMVPNFVLPIRVCGSVNLDPAIARANRKVSAEVLHSNSRYESPIRAAAHQSKRAVVPSSKRYVVSSRFQRLVAVGFRTARVTVAE